MKQPLVAIMLVGLVSCQTPGRLGSQTPLTTYRNDLDARTRSVWLRLSSEHNDQLVAGSAKVRFDIRPNGRIENLKLVSNSGNRILAEIALETVRTTAIPRILPEVLAQLPSGRYPAEFIFAFVAD